MMASVDRVRNERTRVASALTALGFRVAPSQTNFILFDCSGDGAALAASLLQEGIIVKPWLEPGYERYLRVTIGARADNDRLIAALKKTARR